VRRKDLTQRHEVHKGTKYTKAQSTQRHKEENIRFFEMQQKLSSWTQWRIYSCHGKWFL